jgi:hypothetical protein
MKPGDLCRWNYPEKFPASFGGAEIFLITRVEDDRADFLMNGQLVKLWSYDWICRHSEVISETG